MGSVLTFCTTKLRDALEQYFVGLSEDPNGPLTLVLPFQELAFPGNMSELDSLIAPKSKETYAYVRARLVLPPTAEGKKPRVVDPAVLDGGALVYVSVGYQPVWDVVVTSPGNFEEAVKTHPVYGQIYFVGPEGFEVDDSVESFQGMTAFQIRDVLAYEHGDESQIVRDVDRIIHLVRQILSGKQATAKDRKADLLELNPLRLRVGAAARAIIDDFIDEFNSRKLSEGDEDVDGLSSDVWEDLPSDLRAAFIRLRRLT